MDTHEDGNVEQTRVIAKAIARQMIEVYGEPAKEKDLPAPVKWAAGIIAGLMTVGSAGLLFWMVSTISVTQITVMEIKTRQQMTTEQWEQKFASLEQRMESIEQQVRGDRLTQAH